jgi:hypothetical protein
LGIFVAIWYILWSFGIFFGIFWYVVPRKIWQPWFSDGDIKRRILQVMVHSLEEAGDIKMPCRNVKRQCEVENVNALITKSLVKILSDFMSCCVLSKKFLPLLLGKKRTI